MILSFFITLLTLMDKPQYNDPHHSRLKMNALSELKLVLKNNEKFIKAHAAEYLIWTGHAAIAKEAFLKEEDKFRNEPKYRVVIWRVLAQASASDEEKQIWLNKIYDAYNDLNGPDRIHATETLAKLHQPVSDLFPSTTLEILSSSDRILHTYGLWASSYGSNKGIEENKEELLKLVLNDSDIIIKKVSSFCLRKLKNLNIDSWNILVSNALRLGVGNKMYVNLLATSILTAPADADKKTVNKLEDLLLHGYKKYNASERIEITQVLAEIGEKKHLELLEDFLNNKFSEGYFDPNSDEGADLRAGAAYAILKICGRIKTD